MSWNCLTHSFNWKKKNHSQRSKYYRSKLSDTETWPGSQNWVHIWLSLFPFSNKITIFTALTGEPGKQMSSMCVSFRNFQANSNRSCWWSGALPVSRRDPRLPAGDSPCPVRWGPLAGTQSPAGCPISTRSSPRGASCPINAPGQQGSELSVQDRLSQLS